MTNKHRILIVFSILAFSTVMAFLFFRPVKVSYNQSGAAGNLPVVPGAYGFGMDTRAAYGCGVNPIIIRVNTLAENGSLTQNPDGTFSGPFKAALLDSRPRVVVFEVSGYITFSDDWFYVGRYEDGEFGIYHPCLTVAGQTAPSPGITVRMDTGGFGDEIGTIYINTRDVLFQHFRVRPGGNTCNSGITAIPAYQNVYNVVFDHMSVSWEQDEGLNFSYGAHDSTMWRSIVSEGLVGAGGSSCGGGGWSGGHGIGFGYGANLAGIQNLLAHNVERNFINSSGPGIYLANNLIYDPIQGPTFIDFSDDGVGAPSSSGMRATAVGNYLKRGPSVNPEGVWGFGSRKLVPGAQLYMNDNTIDNGSIQPPFEEFVVIGGDGIDPRVGSPPVTLPGYTPMSSAATYNFVLNNAGARPADRDAVDARIISEVQNRTGTFIRHHNDVGGYPSLANNFRAFVVPPNPHSTAANGYTNLENTLHTWAGVVEGTGTTPPPGPPPPSPIPPGSLALNKPATASSVQDPAWAPAFAFDGDLTTRWSSVFSDPQWIQVDLGSTLSVNRVVLNWEQAYATTYSIQVSTNGTSWTNVYSTTTGNGGTDDLSFTSTNARYVRMNGTQRGTPYGYSLYEFGVYGVAPPSLMAWYKFDNNTSDSSGNGLNGTAVNNPTYVSGKLGQGVSFNGTSNYVDLGSPSSLNIQGALSLSLWVNPIPTNGEALIQNGNLNYGLTYYSGGYVFFYIGHGGNAIYAPVSQQVWHHVVGTWDGTTNTNGMKLYVDGVLAMQGTSTVSATGAVGPVQIGKNGPDFFRGIVDDLRVYNYALTSSEIQALATAATPLPGDLNLDHIVNSLDWSYMNSKWFTNDVTADLDHNQLVNSLDFSIMNSNWFKTW